MEREDSYWGNYDRKDNVSMKINEAGEVNDLIFPSVCDESNILHDDSR